jgi:hypothetical protein
MGFLFGGKSSTNADTTPKFTSLRLQTSAYGKPIPLVYGTTRIAPNLVWLGDLTAIKHEQSQSGGKGGGSVTSVNYTYTVAFLMALCETDTGFSTGNCWIGKVKKLSGECFTPGYGTYPWSYLVANHPDQSLYYSNTQWICAEAYDLGVSDNLPNISIEINGYYSDVAHGILDAHPSDVIYDLIRGGVHGALYGSNSYFDFDVSSAELGFPNYVSALGLRISPAYTEQRSLAEIIQEIADLTNSAVVYNGSTMTLVPYGDEDITANGSTYIAPTPQYDLTDDDFLVDGDEAPVKVIRKRAADVWNVVKLEYLDRAYDYNASVVEARDSVMIDMYGERPESLTDGHMFALKAAAEMSAYLRLQRYQILNSYQFKLSARYIRLDPMDVVTITDATLGLNQSWVRIKEIQENEDYTLSITAEDYRLGSGAATTLPGEIPAGPVPSDPSPGDANIPVIFEPSSSLSGNKLEIWAAVSGGVDWGGCEVWLSSDDTSYVYAATVWGGARQGVLSGIFATGADPDTVHTCPVDMSESESTLLSVTQADCDQYANLAYVGGEIIAFQTADLTSQYHYDLKDYIRRGLFGTTIGAHASGSQIAMLDRYIAKMPYQSQWVGQTIYIKLLSFNIFGRRIQTLADVTAYTFVPTGASFIGEVYPPSTPTPGRIPQWDPETNKLTEGLEVVTEVGSPGSDDSIPTEQAVREALNDKILYGYGNPPDPTGILDGTLYVRLKA